MFHEIVADRRVRVNEHLSRSRKSKCNVEIKLCKEYQKNYL